MTNEVLLEVAQVVSALDDGADRVCGLVVDRKQPTSARRMGGDADDDDIGDGDAASGLGDGRDEAILLMQSVKAVQRRACKPKESDRGWTLIPLTLSRKSLTLPVMVTVAAMCWVYSQL